MKISKNEKAFLKQMWEDKMKISKNEKAFLKQMWEDKNTGRFVKMTLNEYIDDFLDFLDGISDYFSISKQQFFDKEWAVKILNELRSNSVGYIKDLE